MRNILGGLHESLQTNHSGHILPTLHKGEKPKRRIIIRGFSMTQRVKMNLRLYFMTSQETFYWATHGSA